MNNIRRKLVDEIMVIDTKSESFDITKMRSRSFLFSPATDTLILGDTRLKDSFDSFSQSHGWSKTTEPFEKFLMGWAGTNKLHPNGVVHFISPFNTVDKLENGITTLDMFLNNKANENTLVRGFSKHPDSNWEQTMKQIKDKYLETPEILIEQNCNMIDGIINNIANDKKDLTDGQTYDEIKELAPETMIENKSNSIIDQIKSAKTLDSISPKSYARDEPCL